MRIRNIIISVILVAAIPLLGGCALFLIGAGVAAGVGTVAYVNGDLRGSEEVSVDHAFTAVVKTMNELEFKISEQQKDAIAGKVVARRADGTAIGIYVKRQTDSMTEIRVRVGTFGDEALSKLIYDKIKKNL